MQKEDNSSPKKVLSKDRARIYASNFFKDDPGLQAKFAAFLEKRYSAKEYQQNVEKESIRFTPELQAEYETFKKTREQAREEIPKIKQKFSLLLVNIIACVFLYLAMTIGSSDIILLTKWILCFTGVYGVYSCHHVGWKTLRWPYGILALLFNPFNTPGFSKEMWILIDKFSLCFLFLVSASKLVLIVKSESTGLFEKIDNFGWKHMGK